MMGSDADSVACHIIVVSLKITQCQNLEANVIYSARTYDLNIIQV